MKKKLRKLTKGLFAIFVIKFILFGSAFIIQSCQNDDELHDTYELKMHLSNFKSSIVNTSLNIKSTLKDNTINTLSKKSNSTDPENEAKELLKPVVVGAKDLLLAYGFTKEEITEEFGSTENKDVLMAGLAILEIEAKIINDLSSILIEKHNFLLIFGNSVNAQTYEDFKHCALDAAGIAGIGILLDHGISTAIKSLGKKAVLRIVGKVLARTLSWVGTVWAIADFSYCMYHS